MLDTLFKVVFLAGLIAAETIRVPHRKRNQRERKQKTYADERTRTSDMLLDFLAFTGMEIVPLIYVLTGWLSFADYQLPIMPQIIMGVIGAIAFASGVWLLYRAHADLGRNWSPTLEITQSHSLVTGGVYRTIRHPIYAAVWLMCLAQVLLLSNWIAGLSGAVLFAIVYFRRVPREEQMMIDHFGDEYRSYRQRTGRVVPRR
jgi:protein-S-isoprenylcysteine O-methyltransferase Ste14